MNTDNTLRTIELIRCADKAATAYRTVKDAGQQAHEEHGAAQTQLNHWNDWTRAMGATDPSPRRRSRLSPLSTSQETARKARKAKTRLQRAPATLPAHQPAPDRTQPAPRHHPAPRPPGRRFTQDCSLRAIVGAASMLDALDGPITWRRSDALGQHLGPAAAGQHLALVTR